MPSLDCPEEDSVDPLALGSATAALDAIGTCRERLVSAGVDLAAYDSAAIAADLTDLRKALGIAEWNLYGISYGTRVALTAMRDQPAGIRSVILDSVYPPQVDLYGQRASDAERAFDVLFAACSGDASCERRHPDLGAAFSAVASRFEQVPVTVTSERDGHQYRVDGETLVDFLFDEMYDTAAIPGLPAVIDDIDAGQYAELAQYLDDRAPPDTSSGPDDIADGMHYSVQCSEEMPFTSADAYASASASVPAIVRDAFDPAFQQRVCGVWDVPALGPIENQPVTSDIPTLILSGEDDPITPPAWAAEASATLSHSNVFEFPGAGHGILPDFGCAASMTAAFLDAPTVVPDASCMDGLRQAPFVP